MLFSCRLSKINPKVNKYQNNQVESGVAKKRPLMLRVFFMYSSRYLWQNLLPSLDNNIEMCGKMLRIDCYTEWRQLKQSSEFQVKGIFNLEWISVQNCQVNEIMYTSYYVHSPQHKSLHLFLNKYTETGSCIMLKVVRYETQFQTT